MGPGHAQGDPLFIQNTYSSEGKPVSFFDHSIQKAPERRGTASTSRDFVMRYSAISETEIEGELVHILQWAKVSQ